MLDNVVNINNYSSAYFVKYFYYTSKIKILKVRLCLNNFLNTLLLIVLFLYFNPKVILCKLLVHIMHVYQTYVTMQMQLVVNMIHIKIYLNQR